MKLLVVFAAGFLVAIAWLDYLFGARCHRFENLRSRFHWRWPA